MVKERISLNTKNVKKNQSEPGDNMEEVSDGEPMADLLFVPRRRSMATGFASLDVVDLEQVFDMKALVMRQSLHPTFMKGHFEEPLRSVWKKSRGGKVEMKRPPKNNGSCFIVPRMVVVQTPKRKLHPAQEVGGTDGSVQFGRLGKIGRDVFGIR